MNHKIVVFCGLLGLAASLQATNTVALSSASGQPAGMLNINGDDVSPYTGTLNGTSVELYCDDFNNASSFGTNWSVNITTLSNTGALVGSANDARYETTSGGLNIPGTTTAEQNVTGYIAPPNASDLYDEMIWLVTQMSDPGISNADKEDIQEAVWALTGTNTVTVEESGASKTWQAWVLAAQANYADTNPNQEPSYGDPNYSLWEIVTDTANTTNKAFNVGEQEFLTYTGGGSAPPTEVAATPEPATFGLLGSALLFGAMLARRRKASATAKV
jgi:hypothetical protein